MTTQILDNNHETLFSFELLVECICINRYASRTNSRELALGVRLLDFPTLLIYQPVAAGLQDSAYDDCEAENLLDQLPSDTFDYAFNKGKSCLFKMNLSSLHAHLSNTPLYVMVLDMKEEFPKLMGTSLISLAKMVDRIRCDVESLGISMPSSQGEKAVVDIFNLMGEKIGFISMGYKLFSLGASLLPHIPESRVYKVGIATQGKTSSHAVEKATAPTKQRDVQSLKLDCNVLCQNVKIAGQATELVVSEAKQRAVVSTSTQTECAERREKRTLESQRRYNDEEEDPAVTHPPHLIYSRHAQQDQGREADAYKPLPFDLESLGVEDLHLSSADETPESEIDAPPTNQRPAVRSSSRRRQNRQQTRDAVPPVPGEALRQLPLLSALLVELSHLSGQTQHPQSLSVPPNLAWLYRPVTESPAAPACSTKTHPKPAHKAPGSPSPRKSQPLASSVTRFPRRDESSKPPSSPPRRLTYGMTKTFRLRMKRVAPGVSRRHECTELFQTQTRKAGGKRSSGKMRKGVNKTSTLDRSAILDEDIDTLVSSVGVDSARRETASPKPPNIPESSPPRRSKNRSLQSEKDRGLWVRIPSVQSGQSGHSDGAGRRGGGHSDLDAAETGGIRHQSGSLSGSSRGSRTPAGPRSDSAEAVEEYADDFTSLDPTDGYSPDRVDGPSHGLSPRPSPSPGLSPDPSPSPSPGLSPRSSLSPSLSPGPSPGLYPGTSPGPLSSPEPPAVQTGRGRASDDGLSSSDGPSVRRRERKAAAEAAGLPVPVRARGSPQRSLRGTHAVRPHAQAAPLSGSSDSGGGGGASGDSGRAREQQAARGRTRKSSVSETLRSQPIGEGRGPVGGYSVDSITPTDSLSSPEPHDEAEEVGDELGSLGFKNKYQHVSELVANKFPGYTL